MNYDTVPREVLEVLDKLISAYVRQYPIALDELPELVRSIRLALA
jgi:predicted transcriptional regulator